MSTAARQEARVNQSTLKRDPRTLGSLLQGGLLSLLAALPCRSVKKQTNKQDAGVTPWRPGRSGRAQHPGVFVTHHQQRPRLQLLARSSDVCSEPAGPLLLSLICQLPCWLMVTGSQWPSSLGAPPPAISQCQAFAGNLSKQSNAPKLAVGSVPQSFIF